MAYFAKKIRYCANPYTFVTLLVLVKKKGGKPVKFILYRYSRDGSKEMIEFDAGEKENAIKAFPYGHKGIGDLTSWQRTTGWLYEVGVGGGYGIYPEGTWVKIGKPALWKKRRKKSRLKFGELGHRLLIEKTRLKKLYREKFDVETELENILYDHDEEGELIDADLTPDQEEKAERLKEEIDVLEDIIDNTSSKTLYLKDEMRFKRKKGGSNAKTDLYRSNKFV